MSFALRIGFGISWGRTAQFVCFDWWVMAIVAASRTVDREERAWNVLIAVYCIVPGLWAVCGNTSMGRGSRLTKKRKAIRSPSAFRAIGSTFFRG